MTQEHTPEPWTVDAKLQIRAPDFWDDGTRAEDWVVAQFDMGCGHPDCNDEANARRVVACVNALAGISTEAIEGGVIAELVEALRNSAALLGAVYAWVDKVDASGGATSISGVSACHAMLKSLNSNRERAEKLVMEPTRNALAKLEASK